MNRRLERVNSTVRAEISKVIASHVRDPRLYSMVSVTRVDTSPDLTNCAVYVSVLGDEADKRSAMRALGSAAGFIRQRMKPKLRMRAVPALEFHLDQSIERDAEFMRRISDAQPGHSPHDGGRRTVLRQAQDETVVTGIANWRRF